jgi:hypothetical protein
MTDTVTTVLGESAAALPTLTVLVGILLNRNDVNRIDTRISALEASLRGEIGSLRSEIAGEISSVRGEIATGREQANNDLMLLLGRDKELDQRITRLESRS